MQDVVETKKESALGAAISHPLRARALTILADRVASSVEIARELPADLSHVSYHVRALKEQGLIEEVGSRPVRGAIERFYRATVRPYISPEEEAGMTHDERVVFAKVIFSVFGANAATSLAAGTLVERTDHYATRVPLRVDEQGWSDLHEAYGELFERVYEIQAESAERLGKTPGEPGIPTISFLSFFEMPERGSVRT
ncbi:MAG: winged helix-turn-helix transcriptional regulator [Actinobacteria bacterium]|nr:winged helix-turn-helix transcriptional regulator [Actinomycetota bacterium]